MMVGKLIESCVWCSKELIGRDKTREHIRPSCVGGSDSYSNIAYACQHCNCERSKITSYYCNYLQIINGINKFGRVSKKLKVAIQTYNKKANSMREMWENWSQLEEYRLGYSPTRSMQFVWYISYCQLREELKTFGQVKPKAHYKESKV
jgi:hypothetical protein